MKFHAFARDSAALRVLFLASLLSYLVTARAAEAQHPWDDPRAALLLDPYYLNSIDWDQLSTDSHVVAIIHRATIGEGNLDRQYFARKALAKKRGYLWGSYHFGVAGNPEKQADYYIDTVQPADNELVALDLEDVSSPKLMNADEALRFIIRVKQRIGRYPVLYATHAGTAFISRKFKRSEFSACPLWYARPKSVISNFPVGIWPRYTLWQFSSELLPQRAVPGTKSDIDVSVYNGTIDELKADWPLTTNSP